MKKTVALFLVLMLTIVVAQSGFAETLEEISIKLTYNGIRVYLMDANDNQLPIYSENGHIYIPLDAFIESIGGTYQYDAENKTVQIEIATNNTIAPTGNEITQDVYDSAKLAYQKLNHISEQTANIMDDVYNAWHYGLSKTSSANLNSFVSILHLSKADVENAIKVNNRSYMSFFSDTPADVFKMTSKNKDFYRSCVNLVTTAYSQNGRFEALNAELTEAKEALKVVGEQFPNYQSLMEFYSKTASYFEFAKNPTGSFEQLSETISEYENSLRNCANTLSVIFE